MSLRKNYLSTKWILLVGSVILIFSCSLFEGGEEGGEDGAGWWCIGQSPRDGHQEIGGRPVA